MNPFVLLNVLQRISHQTRTCPACRHKQLVPKTRQDAEVRCDKCGALIPPQLKSG